MADWQGNAEPEELADNDNYCKHGTFVGNWATGDYLCGWCEDSVSDAEYEAYCVRMMTRNTRRMLTDKWFDDLRKADCWSKLPDTFKSTTVGVIAAMAGNMR